MALIPTRPGMPLPPPTAPFSPPPPPPGGITAPTITTPPEKVTGTGTASSSAQVLTDAQTSAHQIIFDTLNQWGLGTLAQTAWTAYLQGTPVDTVIQTIRSSPEYALRFPGMAALVSTGHAISEADYIAKESADTEMMRAYGVPQGMVTRDELGKLIGNQVSTTELQGRLNDYQDVVQKLPSQVRDYFQSKYGASPGDLLGFWLDPNTALPLIEQKTRAAEIGGAAAISGWGDLDLSTANHLAGFFTDFNQTLAGFGKATQLTGLTQALPDQQAQVGRTDLLNAELGGDALAQQRVQRASDTAKAAFQGGGDYLTGTKGASGLGVPSA